MAELAAAGQARRAPSLAEFVRYVIVGLANTAVAYGIYVLGLELGASYQIASLIALVAGIGVSFVTQGTVVFRSTLRGRLPHFAGLWILLYCANIALIGALHRTGLNFQLAGLAAAVPVNLLAFIVQKRVIFAPDAPDARKLALPWLLALVAVARFDVAVRAEANWDEFLNLSMVYSYARGDLQEILQTVFVHLLRWVPSVSVNELDQIVAARMLMLGFVLATCLAIYGIARRFVERDAALVAVLAWASLEAAMGHGHALRTDTMATALMMSALWLAIARRPSIGTVLALGALAGLAGAITIKAAFFLPPLGAMFCLQLWGLPKRSRALGLLVLGAVAGLGSFVGVLIVHASTFPATASALGFVERTSGATMFSGDYSIVLRHLPRAVFASLGFWLLAITGLAKALKSAGDRQTRLDGLALVSFALPLASLAFYRDAYPYFYPFILAPVAVLAGAGFASLRQHYRIAACGLLALSGLLGYVLAVSHPNQPQRQVLATVHRLFPTPVPYIDHTSMVSSFPKQGFFMSHWGMTDYRSEGVPIMAELIDNRQPRFVLATRSLLNVEGMDPQGSQAEPYGLLAEDVEALQGTYERYWGPIFLPAVKLSGAGTARIRIPGRYRLDASAPVTLGGELLRPGAVRYFRAGSFAFTASGAARLRWAAPPPPASSPPRNLFDEF